MGKNQKKVLVEIFCRQEITYRQQVEMDASDFEKLKECDGDVGESGDREEYGLLQAYINPSDVYDALNEYTDVEVKLAKPAKKKVKA
jgi:hypothetical protein